MKANCYILKDLNDRYYNQISIGIDMSRLEDYINDLANELRSIEFKGNLLFDLLLSNDSFDRFYECYFDGEKFQFETLEKVNDNCISNTIKSVTFSFYEENMDLFDEDFYTDEYKQHILNAIKP